MSGTAVAWAMSSSYRSLSLIEARKTSAWKQAVLATADEWVTASLVAHTPPVAYPVGCAWHGVRHAPQRSPLSEQERWTGTRSPRSS